MTFGHWPAEGHEHGGAGRRTRRRREEEVGGGGVAGRGERRLIRGIRALTLLDR